MNTNNNVDKFRIFISGLVLFLLEFYFLIDIISGIFQLNNQNNSISSVYKMVLFVLMLLIICDNKKTFCYILLGSTLAAICLLHIQNLNVGYGVAVNNLFKLLYCPTMYFCFQKIILYGCESKLQKIEFINEIVFYVNFIFAFMGYGWSTYSIDHIGMKGFFYAGNEVAIVIFCLYVFICKKTQQYFIFTILFGLLSLLLGTKAPLFSIVTFYILITFFHVPRKKAIKRLGFIVICFFMYLNRFFLLNLEVVRFHIGNIGMHQMRNDTFLNAILSGRFYFLKSLLYIQREKFNVSNILWGYGSPLKAAEMDPFDVFFTYGVFMLFFQILFYTYVGWKNRENRETLYFNLVYFLLALFVGHVWFNTTAILLFSMINTMNLNGKQTRIVFRLGEWKLGEMDRGITF